MSYWQSIKQLLYVNSCSLLSWIRSFLSNFTIVIKYQTSPNLCRFMAGKNGNITNGGKKAAELLTEHYLFLTIPYNLVRHRKHSCIFHYSFQLYFKLVVVKSSITFCQLQHKHFYPFHSSHIKCKVKIWFGRTLHLSY